jgi:hypothetical protein
MIKIIKMIKIANKVNTITKIDAAVVTMMKIEDITKENK